MPITSYDLQKRAARFREQRWLIDATLSTIGPEFDQNRLHHLSAPMSPEYRGAVLELSGRIKRFDDFAPEFAAVARRFEMQALSAAEAGHDATASDAFFAASLM